MLFVVTETVKSHLKIWLGGNSFCYGHYQIPRILLHYHVNRNVYAQTQKAEATDHSSAAQRMRKATEMHDNTQLTKCINLKYHAIKYHLQHNCR